MTVIEQDRTTDATGGNGDGDMAKGRGLAPGHTYASVTDKISSIVLTRKTPVGWLVGLGIAFAVMTLLLFAVTWLFIKGVGIWGINVPVMWGFAIVNFVWWVGIGHAGTLISAILLLLRQEWRARHKPLPAG